MTSHKNINPDETIHTDLSIKLDRIRREHAEQLTIVVTGLIGLIFLISLLGALSQPRPYLFALSGGIFLTAAISASSIVVARRHHPALAVALLVAAVHILLLILALVISGAGTSAALMILIITLILASAALDNRQTNIAIIAAVLSGVGAIVLNTMTPVAQITFTSMSIYAPAVVILTLIIFLVLLAVKYLISTMQIRMVTALLAIVTVPLIINAFISDSTLTNSIRETTNRSLNLAAGQTARSIDTFFNNNLASISTEARIQVFADLLSMSSSARTKSPEQSEALALLEGLRSKDTAHISSYALLDKNGYVVVDSTQSNVGKNFKDSSSFATPMKTGKSYASPVEFSSDTNTAYIYFSSPVRSLEGLQVGVLRARYDAFLLQEMLNNNANIFEKANPILVDENGIRLADALSPKDLYKALAPLDGKTIKSLQSRYRLPNRDGASLFTHLSDLYGAFLNHKETPNFTVNMPQGIMAATSVDLKTQPWTVFYLQNESVFLAPLQQQTQRITLLSAFILAIAVALAILLTQLLTRPIVSLTKIANQITTGDLNATAQVNGADEVGMLGSAFNVMTGQLRSFIDNLENRVAERTHTLAEQSELMRYRATQLETVADVARAIASEQDLEKLLTNVTHLTSERFGFYHVGIFLLDGTKEYAVLRAANSVGGQRMLARNHHLKVGQVGIVGYATGNGEPRIATDVGQDATYFNNPDLPATRSEMALPLKVKGEIIGALDVQSTESAAFTQEDISLMATLADQVAIAIDNNRLLAETRQALQESQSLHQRYLQNEWEKEANERRKKSYKFAHGTVTSQGKVNLPEIRRAIRTGDIAILERNESEHQVSSMAVPIHLRGEIIGVIDLQDNDENRHWTQDERTMIASVADQVGLALENARLFEQTVRRAERERKALDITNKIRATNEPEVMIQTAVEELRKALRVTRAQIVLQSPEKGNGSTPTLINHPDGQ